jgi:hypothetical protein
MLKLAFGNILLFVIGIVVLEIAFGKWFLPYVPPHNVRMDRTFTYRQELYEPPADVVYVRDRYALRGVREPLRDVQMVILGGSTTDQRYIPEGDTWQDVIRSQAKVSIANAGVDGMSSTGHLVALTEWLYKLPEFHPGIYLHYIGINDTTLTTGRFSDRSGTFSWARNLQRRSAFAHAWLNLRAVLRGPIVVNHRRIAPFEWASYEPVRAQFDLGRVNAYVEKVYKPNLRSILSLHASRGEKAIFVSQMLHPLLAVHRDGAVFTRLPDLARLVVALPHINAASRSVCEERPDVCRFIDLAGRLQLDPGDFYDGAHTTLSGTKKVGAFLAQELKRLRDSW